jgi:hypothetical protein
MAGLKDRGVSSNACLIVFGRGFQNTDVARQITLRQVGHHTTAAGAVTFNFTSLPMVTIFSFHSSFSGKPLAPGGISMTRFDRNAARRFREIG